MAVVDCVYLNWLELFVCMERTLFLTMTVHEIYFTIIDVALEHRHMFCSMCLRVLFYFRGTYFVQFCF